MKKSNLSFVVRQKLFTVETLEPRILLSADPIMSEMVQQHYNANAENLGVLHVAAPTASENVLLKQSSQENARPNTLNLNLAKAKNQNFALNTINVKDFSNFQNADGRIVIGNENSNAIVTLGDAKTNDGKLAFNQNLLISNPQKGGEIFVNDDLVGGKNAALTIDGSGHTTTLSANISTTNTNITVNDSLKIDGDRTIASGASIQLGSSSDHFIDANSSSGNKLNLTTATTGNVVVKGVVGGDTNKLTGLNIGLANQKTLNVTFDSEVTINGDVTIYASGTVTFNSALNITGTGNLTIMGADLIVFGNNVAVTGNIFLEGNEITLNGGQESMRTTGIGKTLTMRPTSTLYGIAIASPPAEETSNTLNLSSYELSTIKAGFSKIVIGLENTGHADATTNAVVSIGSKAANQNTFFDAVEIYGNKITVEDLFNPDLKFQTKSTLKLDAINNIEIFNEVKAFDSSTNLNQNITLYSANGLIKQTANDGDALSKESIVASTLTVGAETGVDLGWVNAASISVTNDSQAGNIVVNSNAPTTVTTTFTSVNTTTTGNITLSSDVNSLILSTPLTSTSSGNIVVKAGLLTADNTTVSALTGALTLSQAISTTSGTITIQAYSDLLLNNTVSTAGVGALSFTSKAGKILQNFDITSQTGSVISLTAGDNIEMANTKTIFTTGAILLTAGKDVKVSILNSTSVVNVTSTNGAIIDNLTVETPNILGSTTAVLLTAKTGIGAAGVADINTTVATLGATNGATGGIFINETDALTISGSGVKQDGGTGSIVITNGTNSAMIIDGDVNNTGSGHVLIQSQDVLTINKLIKSVAGNISVISAANLMAFAASSGIETTGTSSSIDIDSALSITMASGSTIRTGGGNLRLNARAGNIALSNIDAKTGKISLLTTSSYQILDNDTNDDMDIVTGDLRISTQNLGTGSNAIETNATNLSVSTVGSMFIAEFDGVIVKNIDAITVKRVGVDGVTLTDQIDATQSDLTTITNGAIVLTSSSGDIVIQDGNANSKGVNANGTGNILLNALTGNLRIEAPINSGIGSINLRSGATLTQTADGDVTTSGTGTIDVNATTAIVMLDGALTQTINQDIRYKTITGDISLGLIDAGTGNIAILAGGNIVDTDTTGVEITAKAVNLTAGNGIATAENPLEITVNNLTATSGAGGIFILESNAISVEQVSVNVNLISTAGVSSLDAPIIAADLTSNGSIVLSAADITLKDSNANNKVVSANGTGNVLLNATNGSIIVDSSVSSSAGNISFVTTGNIVTLSTAKIITAATGTIDLMATSGITMVNGSKIQTSNTNVRLNAVSNDITIGQINAGTGNVSLVTAGQIFDANENGIDIIAGGLHLNAMNGAGTKDDALEINVTTLSAMIGNGSLFLTEANDITVTTIDAILVNRVDAKAAISNVIDVAQSDIISTGNNGAIVLTTLIGDITILDGNDDSRGIFKTSAGNILFDAAGNLNIHTNINANGGNISLLAGGNIVQNETGSLNTIGSGTIDLNSAASINMDIDAKIETTGGNIRLNAAANMTIGKINAAKGSVSLNAKNIVDGDNSLSITAANLMINAIGAGTATNSFDISVENLSAILTTGGLFLNEMDGITLTEIPNVIINRVAKNGLVNDVVSTKQSSVFSTTGAIVISTKAGDISVLDGNLNNKGIVTESGNILLSAAGNLNVQSTIENSSGNISLISGATFSQSATGNLTVVNLGTIDVQAKTAIVMANGAITKTTDKDIRYTTTDGDITINALNAGTGNIALLAGGNIIDANTTATDIFAAGVNFVAVGIGSVTNPLEITAAKLTANSDAVGMFITDTNSVSIENVDVTVSQVNSAGAAVADKTLTASDLKTTTGAILLTAPKITITDGGNNDNKGVTSTSGNILLNATAETLELQTTVNSDSGNISLSSGTSLKQSTTGHIITGEKGNIELNAGTDVSLTNGAKIETATGKINIKAVDNIIVNNVSTIDGAISLSASKITITDGNNKGVTSTSGNISLNATAGTLELQTSINSGSGNISLSSSSSIKQSAIGHIITGEKGNIELNAGTDISPTKGAKIEAAAGKINIKAIGNIIISNVSTIDGAISLSASKITITDGNNKGVTSTSGNISLNATAGTLELQTSVNSGSGNISLSSNSAIKQSATGHITTGEKGSIELNAGTDISPTKGAKIEAAAGNIRLKAVGNLMLNTVSTTGNVSLIADKISDGTNKGNIITADGLRINATSFGLNNNPINTNINNLSAKISTGGLFLTEAKDLTITEIPQILSDVKQSDIVSTGAVVIVLTSGNLTLTDGNLDKNSIVLTGQGNLLLDSKSGNLDLQAGVNVAGNISLNGATITQGALSNIITTTKNTTIDVNANTALTMTEGAKIQTVDSNIRLNVTSGTMILGEVNAGISNASLIAKSILSNGSKVDNVTAANLRLSANGVGSSTQTLNTNVDKISAMVAENGLFINEANNLIVTETPTITVNRVNAKGEISKTLDGKVSDTKQSDLVSSKNGSIVLSAAGDISLTKGRGDFDGSVKTNGTGNTLIESRGGFIDIQAAVSNGTGALSLIAEKDIKFSLTGKINGQGTIDVSAKRNVLMSDIATITAQDNTIRLYAKEKLQIRGVNANSVSLVANSIVDAGDLKADITANNLRINAVNGIGTRLNFMDLDVVKLSAAVGKEGLFVREFNTITLAQTPEMTVNRVSISGETTKITDAKQNDLSSIDNGAISIIAENDITISDKVISNRSGDILIQSISGSIFQNAAVESLGKIQFQSPKKVVKSSAHLAQIVESTNPISDYGVQTKNELFNFWTENVVL